MAGQDKTEKATPQRLREARRSGDIPSSPELMAGLLAVAGLVVIQQQGAHVVDGLMGLLSQDLVAAGRARQLTAAAAGAQLGHDLANGLLLLVPIALTMLVGALAIGALNTRGVIAPKRLKPSGGKLNPLKNAKHLISKETLILLLKAAAKVAIAVVVVEAAWPSWQALLPLWSFMELGAAAGTAWQHAINLALQLSAAFVVVGAADAGYRYFSWQRRLRMTKEEVKEESRRSEGNPQVRSRMRQQARRRLRSLMAGNGLRRVPQADVVITNPTHFAIAIQYKPGSMRAPKVIAKGQRLVALRIKEAARQHNIPMVENKPLAQALYKSVEVNREIPPDLYQAVAQVLAFVYRMAGRQKARA
jgi:flagellar biosynthetic protein FlhB